MTNVLPILTPSHYYSECKKTKVMIREDCMMSAGSLQPLTKNQKFQENTYSSFKAPESNVII